MRDLDQAWNVSGTGEPTADQNMSHDYEAKDPWVNRVESFFDILMIL